MRRVQGGTTKDARKRVPRVRKTALHSRGLGIADGSEGAIFLYYAEDKAFRLARSDDGFTFQPQSSSPQITHVRGTIEDIRTCNALHVTTISSKNYFLVYTKTTGTKSVLCSAESSDLIHWRSAKKIKDEYDSGTLVARSVFKKQQILYASKKGKVYIGLSANRTVWRFKQKAVIGPRKNCFDDHPLSIINAFLNGEGIWLLYYVNHGSSTETAFELGAALFDRNDPSRLIWRTEQPIWKQTGRWERKAIQPIGAIPYDGKIILYWEWHGGIFSTVFSLLKKRVVAKEAAIYAPHLGRFAGNPIITPRSDHPWESRATFNPTALYEGGKVHIIYRAIGDSDVSVFGYASTTDGIHIDERLPEPIYVPREPFEGSGIRSAAGYSPYMSGGGGFGGCEDPRVTKIGDRIYLLYVAYDGAHPPRVAMTFISVDDFLHKRWRWSLPQLISAPGVVNKNACLLPEKINGKYVIFHRIFPDILIDFVDDLNFDGSKWLAGHYAIPPRADAWDSRKAGVGATPLKTSEGWLLIYQGVDNRDPGRYKMGAMLLDLADPTRVLHRSRHPVLEPVEHYENQGHKCGVVYPCGAVVVGEQLFVYYGGADTVVCVATARLADFLHDLITYEEATLEPVLFI